jgi:hypothetical protein
MKPTHMTLGSLANLPASSCQNAWNWSVVAAPASPEPMTAPEVGWLEGSLKRDEVSPTSRIHVNVVGEGSDAPVSHVVVRLNVICTLRTGRDEEDSRRGCSTRLECG